MLRLCGLALFVWASLSAAASLARYRVALTLYPGDDAAAIAGQVAATYGGRIVENRGSARAVVTIELSEATAKLAAGDPRMESLVTIELSEATAKLAAGDPRMESLALVSHADPTWTRGTYKYDGSGNISQIGEEDYRYDLNGRLVYGDAGTDARQSYAYDAFGNILTINTVEPGVSPTASRLAVDPATNQIAKPDADDNVIGTYDASGNLTSYNGTTVVKYDALDVVTEATVPDVAARRVFLYTASDERIASINMLGSTVSETEWTLRDAGGKVLRRVSKTPGGTLKWEQDYIYRGNNLLAAEAADNRKTLRFHLDHLGTPRLITANGGVEVARPRYFAFGQEVRITADTEPMKFTGHERDGRSLDYMHARYYDPLLGRFLSVDPGGWDKQRPQTWNRYAYAENNPALKVDPDGRQAVTPLPTAGPAAPLTLSLTHAQQMHTNPGYRRAVMNGVRTLQGAALGMLGVFAAVSRPFLVTPLGTVLPGGKNVDLVPTATGTGGWLQIHDGHDHDGIQPHTHRPETHVGPNGEVDVDRTVRPTTADDIDEADERVKDGDLRPRKSRKDKGDRKRDRHEEQVEEQ